MITLEGLNKRQRAIAELLWNCESQEQAIEILNALSTKDKTDGKAIMNMMIYEILEERVDDEFYVETAKAAIDCARRG